MEKKYEVENETVAQLALTNRCFIEALLDDYSKYVASKTGESPQDIENRIREDAKGRALSLPDSGFLRETPEK